MFAQKTKESFVTIICNLDKILFSLLRKETLEKYQLLSKKFLSKQISRANISFSSRSSIQNKKASKINTTIKTTATVNFVLRPILHDPIYQNKLYFSHAKKNNNFIVNIRGFSSYSNLNNFEQNYSRYSASTIMPHNKFNLNNYDIIGFDLDGTLLRYNLDSMVPLEYNVIANYLVKCKNYPKELLKPIDENIDFLQKGLILDAEHGNILKLTAEGVIEKATHGTKILNENDIKRIYGNEKKWNIATQYIEDPLSAWNGPNANKIRALLDYFDMPASLVMGRAVDLLNNKENKDNDLNVKKIWPDILDALVQMYKREHFASGDSEYFEELKKNPSKYIHKSDPFIIEWLKELKKTKAIYLLTGSNIDFANLTATYALGHNWRDLFDIVIAFAKKPGFFIHNRPFYSFEGGIEDQLISDDSIRMGNVYAQGNWQAIEILLSKKFGKTIKNPRSLYFGDNLIQDVYAPSKYCNLDTVSLVEELEEHECQDGYAFKKVIQSHFWNSYFSINNKPTYWSEIIAEHSKMCLPTVDHLCKNPIDYEYKCSNTLKDLCSSKIES